MRQRYLVTYDIRDPKRLRRTFKAMRGFGDPLQYSVFQCDLSEHEKVALRAALSAIIKADEDQVLIVDLGPAGGRGGTCFEVLGGQRPPEEAGAIVV
jgi:CRISPR-associated protein Cas2